jgi:hypothetical protein
MLVWGQNLDSNTGQPDHTTHFMYHSLYWWLRWASRRVSQILVKEIDEEPPMEK